MRETASPVETVRLATSRERPLGRGPYAGRPEVVALLGVLALGVALRAALLRSSLGALNSDEATVGLMAERILRGDVPLVVAGNTYGGTLEAFLLAPILASTGASAMALKVTFTLLWLLASGVLYLVATSLLGRRPAIVLAGVLWVFSFSMALLSIRPYPGYSSGVVGCLVALLLMLREVMPDHAARSSGIVRDRVLLGFATGLTVWFHPMHVAFLLPGHVFILLRQRRQLRSWILLNAIGGFVGFLPMAMLVLRDGMAALELPAQTPSTYASRLLGFFRELLPRLVSLQSQDGEWTGAGLGTALFLAALLGFAAALLRLQRGSPPEQLVAWIAIAFPFVMASFSTSYFYADARYGIAYAPVILLVLGLIAAQRMAGRHPPPWALFVVPFLWFALFCSPLSASAIGSSPIGGPDAEITPLASALESWGVTEVHADYWIAYRLAFLDKGDLVATPLNNIRFEDDDRRVRAAGAAAGYVVFADDLHDSAFMSSLTSHQRRVVGRFAVYVPVPGG